MRWTVPILSAFVLAASAAGGHAADTTRAAQILDRFEHANRWRNHVMVVAHRTGWKENGRMRFAEDSLTALRNSIALGAEMVELDVRKTSDGKLVVMHDSWLNRTTTCKGEVAKTSFANVRRCHLVIEGQGIVTEEVVPTLKEALLASKDKILVNIDNKLDSSVLPEIAEEARALGMANQIVMKENVWNARRIAETKAVLSKVGDDVPFMPILADDAVHDPAFMAAATKAFSAPAAELIDWHKDDAPMTQRGGPLFSARARAASVAGNWHMWADTYAIVNKPSGMLAGGRGDELAVLANQPEETYGFWVDRGATIIQTDEPKAAIAWLAAHGYRIPYDLTN